MTNLNERDSNLAEFKIRIDPAHDPNTLEDQDAYRHGLAVVLGEILSPLIEETEHSHLNLHHYPILWSQTSRLGASTIIVEGALNDGNSTYEVLTAKLHGYLKLYSRVTWKGIKERRAINRKINELNQFQKEAQTAYLFRLKNVTADLLLLEIAKLKDNERYRQRVEKIKALNSDEHLRSASSCLAWTAEVNALRNDLLELNVANADLNHFAEQLSVVTKRWIDPFYEHPLELTKGESVRRIIRTIIVNLSCALAVAALIIFFFNPAIAFIVGVSSAIGMLPILDDIIEVARNAWHGRAPTRNKVIEVGVALVIVFSLSFCAYAVAEIGLALLQSAPKIAKAMMAFGYFMATTFMRFIDAVLNVLGSMIDGVAVRAAFSGKKETYSTLSPTVNGTMRWLNGKLQFLEQDLRFQGAQPSNLAIAQLPDRPANTKPQPANPERNNQPGPRK